MLDRDLALAVLYEIETKLLNPAVKRNIRRFPKDFMFQLDLRYQIETCGSRYYSDWLYSPQTKTPARWIFVLNFSKITVHFLPGNYF